MYQIKGKIDSNNALEFENEIMAAMPNEIDASELSYISSAGLRVLLKLKKKIDEVTIYNVSPEVYDIFCVTGFDQLLNVKKAFRKISIEGKEIIGRGGNGVVYRLDEETIVKVYKPEYSLKKIEKERAYAKAAFVSGVPSVIAFDTVQVGDSYGVVFEALNSNSLSYAMKNDPEHLDDYVKKYVDFVKTIHTTELSGEEIVPLKTMLKNRVSSKDMLLYCEQSDVDALIDIIDAMADKKTIVHGDLHPGNIMIHNGELMLVDMGEATRGVPIYDIASIYRDLLSGPKTQPDISRVTVGMEPEMSLDVGSRFMKMYSGAQDEQQLQQFLGMLGLVYSLNVVCFVPDIPVDRDKFAPSIIQNLLKPVVLKNAATLKHILSQ